MARFVNFFCFVFPSQLFVTLFFSVSLFFFFSSQCQSFTFFQRVSACSVFQVVASFVVGPFCGLLVCFKVSSVVVLFCYCFFRNWTSLSFVCESVYIVCPCQSQCDCRHDDYYFNCHVRCHWVFSAVWLDPVDGVVLLPNVKYLSAVQNMCPIPTVPIIQLLSKRFSSTRGTKFRLLSCPFLFQQTRHQLDLFLALRQYPIIVDELHRK